MAKILSLSVFKKHPAVATSIVVVGGLIFYFLFLKGGDSSSPASVGYTDANVNAASGLAQAQSAAQQHAQDIQAQLTAMQIQGSNELAVTNAQANLQRDLAAFSLEAAKLDHVRDMYGLEIQDRIEELGIQKSSEIQALTISSQLSALKVQADQQVAIQTLMTNGNIALGQQAANVSIAGINAQAHIADSMYGAQKSAAKSASSASKTSTYAGLAIAAMSLFCDKRIKTIDKCVDNSQCLNAIREMPVEFWHYLEGSEPHHNGDTTQHLNTYSQDFYRELGADDWETRVKIDVVDYLGALTGAIKALDRKN